MDNALAQIIPTFLPTPEYVITKTSNKSYKLKERRQQQAAAATDAETSDQIVKWDSLPADPVIVSERIAENNTKFDLLLNQHRVFTRPCAEGFINIGSKSVELPTPDEFDLIRYMGRRQGEKVILSYEEALLACDCAKLAVFLDRGGGGEPEQGKLLLSFEDCWSLLLDSAEADNRYAVYSLLWRTGYVPRPMHFSHENIDTHEGSSACAKPVYDYACYLKDKRFKKSCSGDPKFYVIIVHNETNAGKNVVVGDVFHPKLFSTFNNAQNKSNNPQQIPVVMAVVVNGKVIMYKMSSFPHSAVK